MKRGYLLILWLCLSLCSLGQTISLTGGAYTQDFNTLANSGTSSTLPAGWFFVETGTNNNGLYTANNGGSNSGDTYSYGTGTNADRAFGGLQSGSLVPTIGAGFTNNTGSTVTSLLISYTGEQWRLGTTGRQDRIDFQYSLDATAINNGTWVNVDNLDFSSPNTTTLNALDGNAAGNRTAISFTITGLNIPDGATVYIRWSSFDASGADDGLSVDDFSITPGNTVTTTVSVATTANGAEPNTDGAFTVTLSSTSASDVVITYTVGGTATPTPGANADYTALSGTVTVPAGQLTAQIPVDVLDDALAEGVETVTVTLQTATAPYTITTANASLDITSEDVGTILFNGSYSQDFSALANSGTSSTTPVGWLFSESGANANTTYAAGDGGSNAGNTYSFGTGTGTDRAFGGVRSGSLIPILGALFTNNTGATVTSLTITYTGEQWRLGTTGRNDRLDFQYSVNNNSITTGTFVHVDGLDFIAPVGSGTAGALDGNASANRVTITYTINGLNIANGANFSIRWTDFDVTGAEDGLGIDDFSITLGCTPPTNQPTALNLTPFLQSIDGNFTAALAGTEPADAYLVLMSTSSSLTELPVSGTVYAVDDVIGNAQVVSITGTSFTATGLTPSTTYYFYVFSASAATNCYNTASPLTGSIATTDPPVCTAPATQASNLNAVNITGTSMDLTWTRGSGDNILVIARPGAPVNAAIYNSLGYPQGTVIGNNTVIYNGPAAGFTYNGLAQNTTYHFALYEYNSLPDSCYLSPALTGNFTTLCTDPVNVSGLTANAGNAQITVSWTLPGAPCMDEIIVVASTASISTPGSTFTGPANPNYTSGEQIVYRGTGANVVVTGLTNGTVYYFKVFTRKGTSYSTGVQVTGVPFDPASGYTYLFGNLHAHSSYSDGNKDNLSNTPDEDFAFARDALCMDFMGMSEHNHSGAGMNYPDYATGFAEANSMNLVPGPGGNTLVTLWGMEWGVINNGGHVLVYGFDDDLIGWEAGNYDIFVQKNDYSTLWSTINARSGAFATLAHPDNTDYGNLAAAYNATADAAIVGMAIESGPAFSVSTTYNDFPNNSFGFLSYYRTMLARGYRLAPQMDQDNHNMTFGTANANRMVVMASAKNRESLTEGIRAMRFYASQDCNLRLDFRNGTNPIGSQIAGAGVPTLTLNIIDPDAEATLTIELWGGPVGGAVPGAAIKTFSNVSSFTFNSADAENVQPNNTTWYYYLIVTQEDGNRAITAPIWYARNDLSLPVTLLRFTGAYNKVINKVNLNWTTVREINTREFVVQRLTEGGSWTSIGKVDASVHSSQTLNYQFVDEMPAQGISQYRLQMVDQDGQFRYSPIVIIKIGEGANLYTLSPNPVHGVTYLRTTSAAPQQVSVTISDYNGRQLLKGRYVVSAGAPAPVSLVGQKQGLYVVRIEAEGKVTAEKLMVY